MSTSILLSMVNRSGLIIEGDDINGELSYLTLISLFTDARADENEELPNGTDDLRGFPGDTFSPYPWGSKIWLLYREKLTTDVRNKAVKYAEQALAWMLIDDGYGALAANVLVKGTIPQFQTLALTIVITKPSGEIISLTVSKRWNTQHAL